MNTIKELDIRDEHWNKATEEYTREAILLSAHLGVDIDDAQSYIDDDDYFVLTDEEANEMVREQIEESVWAFTPSFLSAHTGVDEEIFEALADRCESNNESFKRMIKDFDAFVEDAVGYDGRGHFLSQYDGQEHEVKYEYVVRREANMYVVETQYYYIYRRN